MHCTCKFEKHKQSFFCETYEQIFPSKKHKQSLAHEKHKQSFPSGKYNLAGQARARATVGR